MLQKFFFTYIFHFCVVSLYYPPSTYFLFCSSGLWTEWISEKKVCLSWIYTLLNIYCFNCEYSNLIYVVISQGCKEKYTGETGCLVKERINIYRKHIRQPQYQKLALEEHLRTRGDGKFHMFPFFKINQENKSLRKSYEDYFIDKFKPLLNKKT